MSLLHTTEEIRRLLESSKRIAVVGLSPKPYRDSNSVSQYLLESGYEVIPVNPTVHVPIFGLEVYPDLASVPGKIDIVLVFRRSDFVPEIVDAAIAKAAKVVWMQSGIVNIGAAQKASDAGLDVVMNDCIRTEHMFLM